MRRLIFLIFFVLFLFPFSKVYASNFSTDYSVSYLVNSNTKTRVNFNITLTNTTEQYYASSYTIYVGFPNIENVTASDPDGNITPKITTTSKGESIELDFNKKAVGLGSKLNFNLSFDTGDVAQSIGNVWEINIPGLSNQSDFDSFNVNVTYPEFLGKPVFLKPDDSNLINRIYGNKISFKKSDLGISGISIAFGKDQIYSFDLTYHLENNNLFPIQTEIALPPKTNYQDVAISEINPKPFNVLLDQDGNWLAQYKLNPSQDVKVDVKGKAKVYLYPKVEYISSNLLSVDLKPQKYWESNNPQIKTIAEKLKSPYEIYQYVVDTLSYDFSRVTNNQPREGAVSVLQNPSSAVCLEFTDAFIALARANGIAAREVDGYANTKNTQERPLSLVKDVLHAWPEYYDNQRKMWIMVDPTWGNTTNGIDYFNVLDFDHFAFVIKGKSSTYPVPAGGYKTSKDLNTKDVNVTLSTDYQGNSSLDTKLNIPTKSLPGFPINGSLLIKNVGNTISEPQVLKINSFFLKANKKNITINSIPPYGYIKVPISFEKTDLLTNKTDLVTIQLGKNLYEQRILVSPFVASNQIIGGILSVIFISITIILFRTGRIPFLKRKR